MERKAGLSHGQRVQRVMVRSVTPGDGLGRRFIGFRKLGRWLLFLLAVGGLTHARPVSSAPWVSNGPEGHTVFALAIDPATPSTLYAGTFGGGVFKSTDSGGSWSAVNTGLTNTSVRALAIDPATPSTLYAGTLGGGVF